MSNKTSIVSIESLLDKHIGTTETEKRKAFESELRLDLLGQAIKETRKQRNLTQEQLGVLVGVQKSQISKVENSTKSARLETILKVFEALGARLVFHVEMSEDLVAR